MNIIKGVFLFYYLLKTTRAGIIILSLGANPLLHSNKKADLEKLENEQVHLLLSDQTDLPNALKENEGRSMEPLIFCNKNVTKKKLYELLHKQRDQKFKLTITFKNTGVSVLKPLEYDKIDDYKNLSYKYIDVSEEIDFRKKLSKTKNDDNLSIQVSSFNAECSMNKGNLQVNINLDDTEFVRIGENRDKISTDERKARIQEIKNILENGRRII